MSYPLEKITLEVESHLVKSEDVSFRTIPFHELSINEWIVFEDNEPKYFLDFNRNDDPIIKELKTQLTLGKDLDDCVKDIGFKKNRSLSTVRKIDGEIVNGSWQLEKISLFVLTDKTEIETKYDT